MKKFTSLFAVYKLIYANKANNYTLQKEASIILNVA